MKKILTYGMAIGLALLFTGCFSSAANAQGSLANTGNAANSAKVSNEKGAAAANTELSITDKSKYNDLVTPKWN